MRTIHSLIILSAALVCAAALRAQETETDAPKSKYQTYMPPSHLFSCELPASGWYGFEEEDALGQVSHLLGPENPAGTFRTGLSVRWVEKGQPGYVEPKQAVELMRRPDKATERESTPVRPLRVAGLLARVFEVFETRVLPLERLPASAEVVHRYVAVIPSGANYYMMTLASTRDVYLDFREDYLRCLRTFQPMGR